MFLIWKLCETKIRTLPLEKRVPSLKHFLLFMTRWHTSINVTSSGAKNDTQSGSTTWLCSRTNRVSVLCMRPTTNIQFHTQYPYIIGREHSHVVLLDHINISPDRICFKSRLTRVFLNQLINCEFDKLSLRHWVKKKEWMK